LSRTLPQIYAAAAVRLLLPLLVLPLMAARVGAQDFGRLSFILVWSSLLSMVVEGGFLAAVTRLAVMAGPAGRWRLAQQVFSARCVLSVPVVVLSALAVQWVSATRSPMPWIDSLVIALLACALGWPATWYLQASQQLDRWSRVELVVYAALIASSWLLAHSVLVFVMLQLAASATLAVLGWCWLRRDLAEQHRGAALWSRDDVRGGLRLGWTMMPVSIAGAAYSFALPAAASLRMPQAELGLYFMADRIVRAVMNAADPVFSVVYPRIVGLFMQGEHKALRYAGAWALGGALGGSALLLAGDALWPVVQPLLAPRTGGIDPGKLHAVMCVLGWLLPLLLGWKFIGYWMLGSGRYDHAYRLCVIVGGIVGVVGAVAYGGAAGAAGLAWTAIGSELVVIAIALSGVWIARSNA